MTKNHEYIFVVAVIVVVYIIIDLPIQNTPSHEAYIHLSCNVCSNLYCSLLFSDHHHPYSPSTSSSSSIYLSFIVA